VRRTKAAAKPASPSEAAAKEKPRADAKPPLPAGRKRACAQESDQRAKASPPQAFTPARAHPVPEPKPPRDNPKPVTLQDVLDHPLYQKPRVLPVHNKSTVLKRALERIFAKEMRAWKEASRPRNTPNFSGNPQDHSLRTDSPGPPSAR